MLHYCQDSNSIYVNVGVIVSLVAKDILVVRNVLLTEIT